MSENDCIFCKIAKKEIKAAIEYEDDSVVAFDDRKPQAQSMPMATNRCQ